MAVRLITPETSVSNRIDIGESSLVAWWQPIRGREGRIIPNLVSKRQKLNQAFTANSVTDPRFSAICGGAVSFAPGLHPDLPAFNFDRSSSAAYVTVDTFRGIQNYITNDADTWAFWVYNHNDGGYAPGANCGAYIHVGGGSGGWAFGIGNSAFEDPGNQLLFLRESLAWHYSGANETSGWTHYAIQSYVSWDLFFRIYRNGSLWWEPRGYPGAYDGDLHFGGYSSSNRFGRYRITDVRYYDTSLSATQISNLYELGKRTGYIENVRNYLDPNAYVTDAGTPAGVTYSQLERSQRGFNRGLWTGK